MVAGSQLVHPGALTVLGAPIDISRIACDTYVAAGFTDHITPWKTAYRIIQMVSGPAQFVMCSSGHIQTVVADPKHRGLGYLLNPETPPDAEQWLASAERHEGSWWGHYAAWLAERSGEQVAAPSRSVVGATRRLSPPLQLHSSVTARTADHLSRPGHRRALDGRRGDRPVPGQVRHTAGAAGCHRLRGPRH